MKILLSDEKTLRRTATPAKITDIKQGLYMAMISEMRTLLDKCHDGVALAAPQVGESIRLFIISPKIFQTKETNEAGELQESKERRYAWLANESSSKKNNLVYFNPVIKKVSAAKKEMDEGCLSVNELYGKVSRSTKTLIEAYDENGKKFTRGASGLLAQIFQHEVDHLDGILYTDKAISLQKLASRKTDA